MNQLPTESVTKEVTTVVPVPVPRTRLGRWFRTTRIGRVSGHPVGMSRGKVFGIAASILTLAVGSAFLYWRSGEQSRESAARDAQLATYQAELASYENARDEYNRCINSVERTTELANVGQATADGFVAVDQTFDELIGILERDAPNPPPPDVADARAAVDNLSAAVDDVEAAVNSYEPVSPSTCPATPPVEPAKPPFLTNPDD